MADIIEELPPGAINVLAGYPGALKCTLGEGGGGAGGAGTAAAGGGGATGGGTGGAAGGTPADDGGCGCRLAADRGDRERAPLWLVALVLGGGVRRVARPRSTGPRSKRCS
jgi:hypothetical protein